MVIEKRDSLTGEVSVPGDKSISHRAIVFGALASGITEIDGILMNDSISTIECFRKMHVGTEILPNNKIRIHGNGLHGLKPSATKLDAGESGTTARLIIGVLCGQPFGSTLVVGESAQKKIRTTEKSLKPLRKMGAAISINDHDGKCPLKISPSQLTGLSIQLTPADMHVKPSILAASMYAMDNTIITETIKSRDHTELMMKYFGANIDIDGPTITCRPCTELYAQHVQVPGDLTIASYFMTAGLIVPNSDISLKNIGINPTRAGILDVYRQMGAKIKITNEREANNEKVADIEVLSSNLKGITISEETIVSVFAEIPAIIVAATMAQGTTFINGLRDFKLKDSGKLKLIITELSKMGAHIHETEDGIVIEGGTPLRGTVVESYNDPIMTLTLSIAGLVADKQETMIRKSQGLETILPDFLTILDNL